MPQPKKIFDIIPPKKIEIVTVKKPKPFQVKSSTHLPFKKGFIFTLFFLILIGIFGSFVFNKAKIEIWPETELQNFKTELTIDDELKQANFSQALVPGEIIEEEKNISQQFFSSGTKLKTEKAEGIIRVYNNYHLQQTLLAGTRFWCVIDEEVKEFKIKEKVSIPSKKYLDLEVVASEPGEEYNIEPCTFSIPGLKGTARYTAVYGKSFTPMTGGLELKVPQITQEDLNQAEEVLTEKALEECKASLENKIELGQVLLKDAISQEVIEVSPLAEVGQEVESFLVQAKVKVKSLVFKEEDVEGFAKEFVLSQIPQNKSFYQESLKINYLPESIDLKLGKMSLNLELSAIIYPDIDETNLKKALRGKSLRETQVILENQPQITKVQINFWPFWVSKTPENVDKIKIELKIEPE